MAAAAPMTARARASGQSFGRKFESNETCAPASRAAGNAARTASHAEIEIARLIPEACTKRAWWIKSAGMSAGRSRLAAEPARK
jgi:hypothetical protein